jgi:hypothetical protein
MLFASLTRYLGVRHPIWGPRPDFYCCQTCAGLLIWGVFSDERTGLSFTVAAGPRHRSHSRVRVPLDSWPYFTGLDSRLPQPGGLGPLYLYPSGTGWPNYTPRHWVFFSSRPATRRATVEVLEPASMRVLLLPPRTTVCKSLKIIQTLRIWERNTLGYDSP